ncbi:RidA family protein [Gulosibacter sp. ACHW.36C]|uniref:RidA family protein n=1 Tax=Gulosibacter sediminis TaxID=1729695 RepID=A0ABY4MX12_9MICO|nr:RidA family protein [Gulosibacter sediminis]UQN14652.1 RidA family protein [Gulosibacter sediminis]
MTDLKILHPDGIPAPGGHYSPAVVAGDIVFLAGQTGGDPATGILPDEFEVQVRQALTNFVAAVEGSGSSRERVVKTLCFLADSSTFGTFNEIYKEFFPENPPARSTVGVSFPGNVLFEIEGVALLSK